MSCLSDSDAKHALLSRSELGLSTATLPNSNKTVVCLCQKGGYQKDKIETSVAQNKENKNPDALLLEIQISMIVMKNSMEVLQKLNV